jgi:hypothetical protein
MNGWLRNLTHNNELNSLTSAVFLDRVDTVPYRHLSSADWAVEANTLAAIEHTADLFEERHWGSAAILATEQAILRVQLTHGRLHVDIGSANATAAAAQLARLRELFPVSEPKEGEVPLSFWTYGPHGPIEHVRRIVVPDWDDIADNYPAGVRGRVAAVMDDFRPARGGQLLLWQGEPGTGKTYALRALAWRWRDWARFHYVVDPDQMLGQHADYLSSLLLEGESDDFWRVLVLEDSGELIAADAKQQTGQALSRLLNVVDGLIGQGLRVLVLITTNEELRQLHDAVSRPGRCAVRISFGRFDAAEATAWLQQHGLEPDTSSPATLAELYARKDGYAAGEPQATVGFAR